MKAHCFTFSFPQPNPVKTSPLICLALCTVSGLASAQTDAQKRFAQQLAKDERTIKDAAWMSPTSLYVGVIDNGSPRDGYATYVCNDAKPAGAKMVKVIDIAKLKQTGKFVELGQAWCK